MSHISPPIHLLPSPPSPLSFPHFHSHPHPSPHFPPPTHLLPSPPSPIPFPHFHSHPHPPPKFPPSPTNSRQSDIHIYYSPQTPQQSQYAQALHSRIRHEFPELRIYKLWDRPIGP